MYLIEEEEEVTALFSRFTDFHIELMEVARKYYGADLITFHDDMGTQISTLCHRLCSRISWYPSTGG